MKKILLLIALFSFQLVNAQTKDTMIYLEAEISPEYPGGENAMYEFISKNINYPSKEKDNGISGRVIVRFAVMNDGSMDHIEIIGNSVKGFNDEVIRVVKLMPKWKPGVQLGRPVNVYFTLPVVFQLDDNSKPAKLQSQKTKDYKNIATYIGIVCGFVLGILIYKWIS